MPNECTMSPSLTTEPVKQSSAGKFCICLLAVYFWGVLLSFPYFSWLYANQHGFFSWLLFGEFVPAGQALIWPYYAVSPLLEKGWTQEEKENLAHLKRGAIATCKAMILVEGFAKTGKPTPTDTARVRDLLKEALYESKLVRDDVLAKVHTDLPRMYREKYVGALTRLLRSEATRNDALEAVRLLDEWEDWARAHEKDLRFPKGMRICLARPTLSRFRLADR
jgi:hypothetical protein